MLDGVLFEGLDGLGGLEGPEVQGARAGGGGVVDQVELVGGQVGQEQRGVVLAIEHGGGWIMIIIGVRVGGGCKRMVEVIEITNSRYTLYPLFTIDKLFTP